VSAESRTSGDSGKTGAGGAEEKWSDVEKSRGLFSTRPKDSQKQQREGKGWKVEPYYKKTERSPHGKRHSAPQKKKRHAPERMTPKTRKTKRDALTPSSLKKSSQPDPRIRGASALARINTKCSPATSEIKSENRNGTASRLQNYR